MRALLFFCLLAGCTGGGGSVFAVQLVDENGGRPIDGSGTLTVTVLQDGAAPLREPAFITDGEFQLDLPIPSYEPISVIHAEIEGPEPRIGATTPFRPAYTPGGFARVVMGPPGECVLLGAPTLDRGRRSPGLARVEANLVVIGGSLAGGEPVGAVDTLVSHQLTDDTWSSTLETLSPPVGAARIVPFSGTTELFVLTEDRAIRFETGAVATGETRASEQPLHSGAGALSAIADLGARGIAVVGGRSGDFAVDQLTVVQPASTDRFTLAAARSDASAIAFQGGILVAGGQPEGAPLFEWIGFDGTRAAFGDTGARRGGALVRSPDGTAAFYYLGVDGSDVLASSSWVVGGCPRSCEALPGPATTPLRAHAVTVPRTTGTVVLGGETDGVPSNLVEEVRFVAGVPEVVTLGALRSARRDPTAIALWSDLVLVAGGEGLEGTLSSTMELCLPQALPEIVLP